MKRLDNIDVFIKAITASIMGAISVRLGMLGELLWLFLAAVVLDYITGVTAAAYNKELSSGTGYRGIIKKVGKCAVIAVALLCDEVAAQAGVRLGFAISTGGAITAIVTIWLILNELISILENLAKMDIGLPPFLLSAVRLLKKQTEIKAEETDTKGSSANASHRDYLPLGKASSAKTSAKKKSGNTGKKS